jgi:hypothetical protein
VPSAPLARRLVARVDAHVELREHVRQPDARDRRRVREAALERLAAAEFRAQHHARALVLVHGHARIACAAAGEEGGREEHRKTTMS